MKQYKANFNFFDKIDDPKKAYWLGFIYADGGVSINLKNNSCELAIKLQASDANHLKKFNIKYSISIILYDIIIKNYIRRQTNEK